MGCGVNTRATVGFEAKNVRPDTDFQVVFTKARDDIAAHLMAFRDGTDDGYFLLLLSPGLDTQPDHVLPKDVVFVLDTSGSMAGDKLKQAQKALLFCIENLGGTDRFEIIRFSTEVEPVFGRLADTGEKNRDQAAQFLKDLKPIGGTAIEAALSTALKLRPEKSDRPFVVIFLTDGQPTIGSTSEDEIVTQVDRASGGATRVFCFGIGTDVNTHLLDRITEKTRAVSQYVLPEEDIEVKVSGFFSKIKEPVLAGPTLTADGPVRLAKMYPSPLPDLFRGDQLVLTGRYDRGGRAALRLEGMVNGKKREFVYNVEFLERETAQAFIPRLWAARRIGFLLDEIRLRGENAELRDEVADLARRFGIVTPYTSYRIVEDEERRSVPVAQRSLQILGADPVARAEAGRFYDSFNADKSGQRGVGAARSYGGLKAADKPDIAVAQSTAEVEWNVAQEMAVSGPTPAPSSAAFKSMGATAGAVTARMTQQSRFIAGRNFFQNGSQWVDSNAQNLRNPKRVQIPFNSTDYFALMKKHPEAWPWLSLGRNIQLVLGDTLYEIVD